MNIRVMGKCMCVIATNKCSAAARLKENGLTKEIKYIAGF